MYTPSTSVYISHLLAEKAAAKATADVSEPPLPNVVTLFSLEIPWKPEIIATKLLSKDFNIFSVLISLINAFPWTSLVIIGTCQPSQERDFISWDCRAIDNKAAVTCSPEDRTASYSSSG